MQAEERTSWQRHCTWIAPHCSHRARASNGTAVLLSSTLAAAAAIKCADWLNVHAKRASQACARAGQARLSWVARAGSRGHRATLGTCTCDRMAPSDRLHAWYCMNHHLAPRSCMAPPSLSSTTCRYLRVSAAGGLAPWRRERVHPSRRGQAQDLARQAR